MRILKISSGWSHSIAMTDKGHWYGWGQSTSLNQLIHDSVDCEYISVPQPLYRLIDLGNDIIDVFCGYDRTTIIIK